MDDDTSVPGAAEAAGVLTRTISQLSTVSSLEEVTGIVSAAVRTLMGADGATFVLREDEHCYYVDEDAIEPLWKGSRFPIDECVSGWSMLRGEAALIPDVRVDPRIPQDAYRRTFVRSLCMTPIRATAPIGALGAYWRTEHTPSRAEVRLLSALANSSAVALENLELRTTVDRRSAERDAMTARRDELELALLSMAHDLRGPLGAVLGYAELLDDGVAEDPEAVRHLGRTIHQAGQRMSAQIDQMLALYRVTGRTVQPARVDLTAMARTILAELVAAERDRDIEVEVAEGLVAHADPELMHLALHNLLTNALKFTRGRAPARVQVGRAGEHGCPAPPAAVAAAGDQGVFVVRDNGAGFDPEHSHRLFQPLVRLHPESDFPGTGLGLASVARIVEGHGGQVAADSRPGGGATFWFSLPASRSGAGAGTAHQARFTTRSA